MTALRLARAYDEADGPFRRLATAVAKFWVCKRTPPLVAEALECLGGNGYVEESQLPRLFRESPLNSIWEGSGNVNALDVLRALAREPETAEAFLAEVGLAGGPDARLDASIARLERGFRAGGSRVPAACSSCSRSRSRARFSSATVLPRSPTPSARGSASRAASRDASRLLVHAAIVTRSTPGLPG